MKILICGLSGSGKTTLADKLNEKLGYTRINADAIRTLCNDWDFSNEGRVRQAKRLKELAEQQENSITDFIAPTEKIRDIFGADIIIWMDTVSKSIYEDTDKVFEAPTTSDYRVTTKDVEEWSVLLYNKLKYFK